MNFEFCSEKGKGKLNFAKITQKIDQIMHEHTRKSLNDSSIPISHEGEEKSYKLHSITYFTQRNNEQQQQEKKSLTSKLSWVESYDFIWSIKWKITPGVKLWMQ